MSYSVDDILKLSDINTRFYNSVSTSFSQTRKCSWPGWNKCIPYIKSLGECINIADIGCGNLRFYKYLSQKNCVNLQYAKYDGYDNCYSLLPDNVASFEGFNFINTDIVNSVLNNQDFLKSQYDLIVCFGFMHHVAGKHTRLQLINYLLDLLNIDGLLIISFWQFCKNKKIKSKAINITENVADKIGLSSLEENDYFLNWQDNTNVYRYCHNFTHDELKDYSENLRCNFLDSFYSDGKDENLNEYIILQNC